MHRTGPPRSVAGSLLAVVLLGAGTPVLVSLRGHVSLASVLLLYLIGVVLVALVGGLGTAVVAAALATALVNFWFVAPLHRFAIKDGGNVLALGVFVFVAVLVSTLVDVAGKRGLEAARRGAEDAARATLLAAVGHDLRTPLAGATAAVTGLQDRSVHWSDQERAELVDTAAESLDRLAHLVDDLLDISRLQSGVMPIHPVVVGLDEVVPGALEAVAPGQQVLVDVPETLPAVLADPGLLERAVANLVQNALRHGGTGASPELRAMQHGRNVELSVIDHGPGIASAELARAFAPFQRADDRSPHGVGLGLAIARGFVLAMGGTLTARETPGGGLTMVLALPAAPS